MKELGRSPVRRRGGERSRLALAKAFLALEHPFILADNPLLDAAGVGHRAREAYAGELLAEERALADLVREAGEDVRRRLGADPRLVRERTLLEEVLAGGSVTSAGTKLHISREHLSNTAWRRVTGWAYEAFEELCREQRPDSDRRTPAPRKRLAALD